MATYCTQSDIEAVLTEQELIQLADLDEDGAADSAVVTRACTNASDIIEAYISPRYPIPFDTAPALLKTIAVRMAIYYLHVDRRSVTDDIRDQGKDDLRTLEKIGKGEVSLGDPANAAPGDRAPGIKYESDDREMTREKTEGW